jgi:hypothetical protein
MWQPAEYSVLRRNTIKSWKIQSYEFRGEGVALGVGKFVLVGVMMMMMIMMMTTTAAAAAKPLSSLPSTVPDRQSKRRLYLASRPLETPLPINNAKPHSPINPSFRAG